MTTCHRPTCAAALVALTLVAIGSGPGTGRAGPQDEARQTFRSGAAAVTVDVSVREPSGRPITGLTKANFRVLDNGVSQDVTEVSYGKVPIDVTIALDVSYSVSGGLLTRLRDGVVQLMRDLKPADRLKLVLFNMRVTRATDYTNDTRVIERAMRGAVAGGGTALLDTVSVTVVDAAPPGRRQLNVFFTDGRDSSSTTSPATITEVARRARATLTFVVPAQQRASVVPLYAVPLRPDATELTLAERAGLVPVVPPLLAALAAETGGTVLSAGATSDLTATFRRALEQFRTAYVLYYTARNVERSGYHALEVTVDRKDAVIQARRGYFGS